MPNSEIATLLRKLRLEHNFTLQGVAKALHISQATYSRIEYGKRELTFKEAQLLAKLYHTPIEELFTDEEGQLLCEYDELYRAAIRCSAFVAAGLLIIESVLLLEQ